MSLSTFSLDRTLNFHCGWHDLYVVDDDASQRSRSRGHIVQATVEFLMQMQLLLTYTSSVHITTVSEHIC